MFAAVTVADASSFLARFQDHAEYAFLRTVVGGLDMMPLDLGAAAMARIWRGLAPWFERHSRADRHLQLAMPQLSNRERKEILNAMWDHLGRVAAEGFKLSAILDDMRRIEVDDSGLDGGVASLADGFIGVSFHSGNWEVAAAFAKRMALPGYAVYRPLRNPLSDAFLLERRRAAYTGGLIPTDRQAAIKLHGLARSQRCAIGFLGDLRTAHGPTVTFFGHPATATTFPYTLARRFDLPLVLVRTVRLGRRTLFRIDMETLDIPRTDDPAADVLAAAQMAHRRFEAWIREHPEQWMWAHRKWEPLKSTRKQG